MSHPGTTDHHIRLIRLPSVATGTASQPVEGLEGRSPPFRPSRRARWPGVEAATLARAQQWTCRADVRYLSQRPASQIYAERVGSGHRRFERDFCGPVVWLGTSLHSLRTDLALVGKTLVTDFEQRSNVCQSGTARPHASIRCSINAARRCRMRSRRQSAALCTRRHIAASSDGKT